MQPARGSKVDGMTNAIPLISSQRYLDRATVMRKACMFKVFVVRTVDIELRGVMYRVLIDGHHNYAAAKLVGVEPQWRGPSLKTERVMRKLGNRFPAMLINNLTDSDWYYMETGHVVTELLGIERNAA